MHERIDTAPQDILDHVGLIYLVCRQLRINIDDDIKQIGLIAINTALKKYNRDIGKFSTYAVLLIKRQILKYINKQNKQQSIEYPISNNNVDINIFEYLPNLSKEEHVIINHYIQGYSLREIAKILGLGKTTVCKKFDKIKTKIRIANEK